jgi:hypothetical protein
VTLPLGVELSLVTTAAAGLPGNRSPAEGEIGRFECPPMQVAEVLVIDYRFP